MDISERIIDKANSISNNRSGVDLPHHWGAMVASIPPEIQHHFNGANLSVLALTIGPNTSVEQADIIFEHAVATLRADRHTKFNDIIESLQTEIQKQK